MKGYSTLPKAPQQEPRNKIDNGNIKDIRSVGGLNDH